MIVALPNQRELWNSIPDFSDLEYPRTLYWLNTDRGRCEIREDHKSKDLRAFFRPSEPTVNGGTLIVVDKSKNFEYCVREFEQYLETREGTGIIPSKETRRMMYHLFDSLMADVNEQTGHTSGFRVALPGNLESPITKLRRLLNYLDDHYTHHVQVEPRL